MDNFRQKKIDRHTDRPTKKIKNFLNRKKRKKEEEKFKKTKTRLKEQRHNTQKKKNFLGGRLRVKIAHETHIGHYYYYC